MEIVKNKKVLISGASISGLTTAWWMNKLGYKVTVVEIASQARTGGTSLNLSGNTIEFAKQMGIYDQILSNSLSLALIEFKDNNDITINSIVINDGGEEQNSNEVEEHNFDEIEIDRSKLVGILLNAIGNDVDFMFNNSITVLNEIEDAMEVTFADGSQKSYELVIGCDGMHSGVRKLWFGVEKDYTYFLKAYGSITTLDKELIAPNTMQWYNVPGKAYMLSGYKDKTDIVFFFISEKEITYDFRNIEQQRKIVLDQFVDGWRTAELMGEVKQSDNFYFVNLSQIKMPSWTKGRVALVGDAAHCASPAAGMGGSLAMEGAGTLAHALEKNNGNYAFAFEDYNKNLRPFVEEIQARAESDINENWIPRTQEAIDKRNTDGF
ncbi:FAD-dependent monooxygenase [Flavobacterium salmonis]|uniref:FAD-binding domain-containing protein n=1 Tax=Flavobacterium salmonis TaxID=2654844 RepID=A0A6V6YWR4_9FLAO|nr:FAD-dependent monooxygenase [Flavobacterium salmonis]CAD0003978.1 hypothetical protein FLAT13_01981 [Flavobacterium salmonis]